ncbi:MAG: hypothetical protein ABIV26_08315 [Candidatus Limnocylindrales bacterium]
MARHPSLRTAGKILLVGGSATFLVALYLLGQLHQYEMIIFTYIVAMGIGAALALAGMLAIVISLLRARSHTPASRATNEPQMRAATAAGDAE